MIQVLLVSFYMFYCLNPWSFDVVEGFILYRVRSTFPVNALRFSKGPRLCLDKGLDVPKPPDVLLLLLVVDIIGDE